MENETELKFVNLSSGAYSDYDATYYIGNVEITQKELDKKGTEIGDILLAEWNGLPEKKHEHVAHWGDYPTCKEWNERWGHLCPETEKYIVETGKVASKGNIDGKWKPLMEEWLSGKGYKKFPEEIPEINIYYDIPISKK